MRIVHLDESAKWLAAVDNCPVFDVTTKAVNSPFERYSRNQWTKIAGTAPLPLTQADIERIASLGDPIDMHEADVIYRPLSALLQVYVEGNRRVAAARNALLQSANPRHTPFVIGIGGSVAVGKSSVARLLRLLLSRWPYTPRVDLVTTDGFLYPNEYLEKHGLMDRKGFPESYNNQALLEFMAAVKSGVERVEAPVYSHVIYDIVPGETITVEQPDILILEGLTVLDPPELGLGKSGVALSDYFDFSIYVDANPTNLEQWFTERFLQLRDGAFNDLDSYFREYANMDDEQALKMAKSVWDTINMPNLMRHILPTRPRASLVLHKSKNHRITQIYLRRD